MRTLSENFTTHTVKEAFSLIDWRGVIDFKNLEKQAGMGILIPDPFGYGESVKIWADPRNGQLRKVQIRQESGQYSAPIKIDDLPYLYREYVYGVYQHYQRVNNRHEIEDDLQLPSVYIVPKIEKKLPYGSVKAAQERHGFEGYGLIQGLSGNFHALVHQKTREIEYVCFRQEDGSFSPFFLLENLSIQARESVRSDFGNEAAISLPVDETTPESEYPQTIKDLIDRVREKTQKTLYLIVGTSGIGKDTTIDRTLETIQALDTLGSPLLHKSQSRVSTRKRRKTESKADSPRQVSPEELRQNHIWASYQSRQDNSYGFDGEVLLQEFDEYDNVAIMLANADALPHVRRVMEQRLDVAIKTILIDKDTDQTTRSILGRKASNRQKAQRLSTNVAYQQSFRAQRAESQGQILTIINNFNMFDDLALKLLRILAE